MKDILKIEYMIIAIVGIISACIFSREANVTSNKLNEQIEEYAREVEEYIKANLEMNDEANLKQFSFLEGTQTQGNTFLSMVGYTDEEFRKRIDNFDILSSVSKGSFVVLRDGRMFASGDDEKVKRVMTEFVNSGQVDSSRRNFTFEKSKFYSNDEDRFYLQIKPLVDENKEYVATLVKLCRFDWRFIDPKEYSFNVVITDEKDKPISMIVSRGIYNDYFHGDIDLTNENLYLKIIENPIRVYEDSDIGIKAYISIEKDNFLKKYNYYVIGVFILLIIISLSFIIRILLHIRTLILDLTVVAVILILASLISQFIFKSIYLEIEDKKIILRHEICDMNLQNLEDIKKFNLSYFDSELYLELASKVGTEESIGEEKYIDYLVEKIKNPLNKKYMDNYVKYFNDGEDVLCLTSDGKTLNINSGVVRMSNQEEREMYLESKRNINLTYSKVVKIDGKYYSYVGSKIKLNEGCILLLLTRTDLDMTMKRTLETRFTSLDIATAYMIDIDDENFKVSRIRENRNKVRNSFFSLEEDKDNFGYKKEDIKPIAYSDKSVIIKPWNNKYGKKVETVFHIHKDNGRVFHYYVDYKNINLVEQEVKKVIIFSIVVYLLNIVQFFGLKYIKEKFIHKNNVELHGNY